MTRSRLFGTDGIRGPFGVPPLDGDSVRRLGLALGSQLAQYEPSPSVLVAGDTRSSTPDLCRWLAEGLTLHGTRIFYGGILPTPAVARLVPQLACRVGIAVSASHNPYPDNGIKLVDHRGFKWPPERERELERQLDALSPAAFPTVELTPDPTLADAYLASLAAVLEGERRLDGLRVTLDTANGAATDLAAKLFRQLGATVHTIGDIPDGRNINAGFGSMKPAAMAKATVGSSSQLGFAFDGDADRVLLADEVGKVHTGDAILFLLAVWMRKRGRLKPPRLVATTMSNLGLEIALAEHDIEMLRCGVGDRVVVRTLQREGLLLGGEQSGHVVHLGLGSTGDGLLTALLVSLAFLDAGRPLSEILTALPRVPQVLRNVRVRHKPDLDSLPAVAAAATRAKEQLGKSGRLVLRHSGTEPLCRIMIESSDAQLVDLLASELEAIIRREIGAED